jgi:hypothetical protein
LGGGGGRELERMVLKAVLDQRDDVGLLWTMWLKYSAADYVAEELWMVWVGRGCSRVGPVVDDVVVLLCSQAMRVGCRRYRCKAGLAPVPSTLFISRTRNLTACVHTRTHARTHARAHSLSLSLSLSLSHTHTHSTGTRCCTWRPGTASWTTCAGWRTR